MSPVSTETLEQQNLAHAIEWVRAIESGQTEDALERFVTPDVIHEDMPNKIFPNGVRSDLPAMRAGAARGKALMRSQRYDIVSAIASGTAVAMQLDWTAELAVPVGTLAPGDTMRAHVAIFMEFRDGRICHQRDYGCYEPF